MAFLLLSILYACENMEPLGSTRNQIASSVTCSLEILGAMSSHHHQLLLHLHLREVTP